MDLAQKNCIPCSGDGKPFSKKKISEYIQHVPTWSVDEDDSMISKRFTFEGFEQAISFVNHVADVAHKEQHHPDIHIFYDHVDIDLWTHAIGGLHENDFIVAAKIDQIIV